MRFRNDAETQDRTTAPALCEHVVQKAILQARPGPRRPSVGGGGAPKTCSGAGVRAVENQQGRSAPAHRRPRKPWDRSRASPATTSTVHPSAGAREAFFSYRGGDGAPEPAERVMHSKRIREARWRCTISKWILIENRHWGARRPRPAKRPRVVGSSGPCPAASGHRGSPTGVSRGGCDPSIRAGRAGARRASGGGLHRPQRAAAGQLGPRAMPCISRGDRDDSAVRGGGGRLFCRGNDACGDGGSRAGALTW